MFGCIEGLDEVKGGQFQDLEDPGRRSTAATHWPVSWSSLCLRCSQAPAGRPRSPPGPPPSRTSTLECSTCPMASPRMSSPTCPHDTPTGRLPQACFASWLKSLRTRPRRQRAWDNRSSPDGKTASAGAMTVRTAGRAALRECLGERVRAVAGSDRLRREVQRDHGHPRIAQGGGHWRDHHDRRDGGTESDRRADHRGKADYVPR